jgi:rhamnosyltransferase
MHDLWIYSIALAADAYIVFDPQPHILYRQHGNNAVGQGQGFVYEWAQRFKRFSTQSNERFTQAQELAEGYLSVMSPKNVALLRLFLEGKKNFWKRIGIIRNHDLRCADRTTQLLFWLNVFFNKY